MIKVNQFGCCSKEVQGFLKTLAFHGLRSLLVFLQPDRRRFLQRLSQYRQQSRECALMPRRKILRKGTTTPEKIKKLKTDG